MLSADFLSCFVEGGMQTLMDARAPCFHLLIAHNNVNVIKM